MSELFPQPSFDSNQGLYLSGFAWGSGSIASFGSGSCNATSLTPLTAGTYRVTGNAPAIEEGPAMIHVGCRSGGMVREGAVGSVNSAGPFTIDIVVTHDPDSNHQGLGILATGIAELTDISFTKIG